MERIWDRGEAREGKAPGTKGEEEDENDEDWEEDGKGAMANF